MHHRCRLTPPAIVLASLVEACAIPEPFTSDNIDAGSTTEPVVPPNPDVPRCTQVRATVEGLFSERCVACHAGGNTKGGLGDVTDLDGLITEHGLVKRGDAGGSVLYNKLASGSMPQGGPPFAQAHLDVVAEWINVCTDEEIDQQDPSLTEPPGCSGNKQIPFEAMLESIRADIAILPHEEALFTRYFTFTHLHNAGYCETQLEGYRHAIAKLLNHLSQGPYIITPEAIDLDRTIFRINLNDFGWTPELWGEIVATNPYSLVFENDSALTIQTLTEAAVFTLVGDWFIEAASQPPLYHTILGIPETRLELESKLGVQVDANIAGELSVERDFVIRAGLQTSGVSNNNRVIERHQIPTAPERGYWLSYDFGSNADPQKDIFDLPLAFQQDGGEIIFNLPNGLQGYMIVNSAGKRLDAAPATIVRDRENPLSEVVTNGVSCMGCHSEGMRLAVDDVWPFVDNNPKFSVADQEKVERLYGPPEAFAAAQQHDVETFANAMALTGSPRLVGGQEPVIAVHIAFDNDLDLRRVAAEFGLSVEDLMPRLGTLKGLDKLPKLAVDRKTFQESFCVNAQKLNLVPFSVASLGTCVVQPIPQ